MTVLIKTLIIFPAVIPKLLENPLNMNRNIKCTLMHSRTLIATWKMLSWINTEHVRGHVVNVQSFCIHVHTLQLQIHVLIILSAESEREGERKRETHGVGGSSVPALWRLSWGSILSSGRCLEAEERLLVFHAPQHASTHPPAVYLRELRLRVWPAWNPPSAGVTCHMPQ